MKVKVVAVCNPANQNNVGTVCELIRLVPHGECVPEVSGCPMYGTGFLVKYPDGSYHAHDIDHVRTLSGEKCYHHA